MKIIQIKYPTPLTSIKDIENDNIDVFVELEDGTKCTVVVATPKNLLWYMKKETKNYVDIGIPFIFVNSLTEKNITNALEYFAEDDAYWLKLYHLLVEKCELLDINSINNMIRGQQE